MKRLTCILAFVLVFLFPAVAYGATSARLIIDNNEVTGLDVPPIIMSDRVMVPARGVFERVGGTVEWNNGQVTVRHNNDVLIMTIGETVAWRNGEPLIMDVAPIIQHDRTLIPLRFPSEAFGFFVDWDNTARAAIINSCGNGQSSNNNPGISNPGNNNHPGTNIPAPESDIPAHEPEGHIEPTPTPPPANSSNISQDVSSTPIRAESHPLASITTLHTPSNTGAMAYAVVASSAISNVNHFMLPDNRLVVDIYNSRLNISGPFLAYGPVREVRSSQFSVAPYVTRVVFELSVVTEFNISLSSDRRTLTVAFSENRITVTPSSGADMDAIAIRGDFQPAIRLSAASYPRYLGIYVDNVTARNIGEFSFDGVFVSHYDVQQRTGGTAFIRVFMHGDWPAFNLNHGNGYVSVIFNRGLHGVRYNFATRELRLSREAIPNLDITQIRHNNEYMSRRYTINLPIPAYGLGMGSLYLADSLLSTANLRRNSAGNAQIVFETSRIMAFTIHVTDDDFVIRARQPRDVHPFIVVLDPGHGGRDPGAVGHGVRESVVVLAISNMVYERLSRHSDIQVYRTRHTDVAVTLGERTRLANQVADIYVSIHANAVRNRPNVSGIETWYLPHAREANMSINSHQLARIMQTRMINATGAVDRGLRNTSAFVVLRDTNMPSVLLEVGFLTNAEEAARLNTTAHQQVLAQAIYEGILEARNQHRR